MATNQDTFQKIKEYLNQSYTSTDTYGVPKKHELTFGNTVKTMKHAKIFYIDMRKSREILEDATDFWSVKIHKSFLLAVTHCIEMRGGHLRSFNGDGILAFFIAEKAASRAVRAAMDIKGFTLEINEILKNKGKSEIDFGIGIAQGKIMVAKSGKAGDDQTKQDLIWIGTALYVAVELSELGSGGVNIWISYNVYKSLEEDDDYLSVLYSTESGKNKWYDTHKTLHNGHQKVHHTNWYFNI